MNSYFLIRGEGRGEDRLNWAVDICDISQNICGRSNERVRSS